VAPLVVDGVDGAQLHEVVDLDGAGRRHRQVFEILVLENHILVGGVGVAPHDVLLLQGRPAMGAPPLVAHPGAAAPVQQVEGDALVLGGGVQAHRYVDQAEADGAFPDAAHGGYNSSPSVPGLLVNSSSSSSASSSRKSPSPEVQAPP